MFSRTNWFRGQKCDSSASIVRRRSGGCGPDSAHCMSVSADAKSMSADAAAAHLAVLVVVVLVEHVQQHRPQSRCGGGRLPRHTVIKLLHQAPKCGCFCGMGHRAPYAPTPLMAWTTLPSTASLIESFDERYVFAKRRCSTSRALCNNRTWEDGATKAEAPHLRCHASLSAFQHRPVSLKFSPSALFCLP